MPRPATGSPKWDPKTKRWVARVTIPGSGRVPVPLDVPACLVGAPGVKCTCASCQQAVRVAKIVSVDMRTEGRVPSGLPMTVNEYAAAWLNDRERRKLTTVSDDRGRLDLHVLPHIGTIPIAAVTRDDLKRLVATLDEKVRTAAEKGERFSWKTAVHVWGNVTKMFSDAVKSKNPELCVLTSNPCADVAGPDRGKDKRKQYLWPAEALAFMACEEIPLVWRRLFAVTTYLYARPEEVEALEWGTDLDLYHGTCSITKAVERARGRSVKKGAEKEPKTTNAIRTVPIDPALLPLLEAMRKEAGGKGRVFPVVPGEFEMSRKLRAYLELAGVDRPALFATTAGSLALTWYHATRSTGITWEAVRGLDGTKLMRRAGHATFSTTLGYIREAENLVGPRFGTPFPPLPDGLIRGRGVLGVLGPRRAKKAGGMVGATGFEPVTSTV